MKTLFFILLILTSILSFSQGNMDFKNANAIFIYSTSNDSIQAFNDLISIYKEEGFIFSTINNQELEAKSDKYTIKFYDYYFSIKHFKKNCFILTASFRYQSYSNDYMFTVSNIGGHNNPNRLGWLELKKISDKYQHQKIVYKKIETGTNIETLVIR